MLKQNSFGIKVLSLVLSVLMTISALPLSVFAIESTDGNNEEIADNLIMILLQELKKSSIITAELKPYTSTNMIQTVI